MWSAIKQRRLFTLLILSVLLYAFYETLVASDRYVSEAYVVLESPQLSATGFNLQSLFSGGGTASDLLLLREHMLSVDMLRKADQALDLRAHYANSGADILSALWDANAPIEDLHTYYLRRVQVELDDYAQVLRVRAEAFTPQFAQALDNLLLTEGERHMNALGQKLAQEQVRFLEGQVDKLYQAFGKARTALIDYQNLNGLVSPTGTIEGISSVVATLEAQLASLKAKRAAMQSYQSQKSAELFKVQTEIKALEQQITREQNRMATQSGNALNRISSEYQLLELRLKFALESYSGALAALENVRIEAARKLKQVSVLQSPVLPEYASEPRRLHNILVFAVLAGLVGLILNMLILIVRDHRD